MVYLPGHRLCLHLMKLVKMTVALFGCFVRHYSRQAQSRDRPCWGIARKGPRVLGR